jgi:cation diffusion facilitator family transporter
LSREALANRAIWIGLLSNLLLTAFKIIAGILGHSGAMLADAVHSLSDFATDIVVLVGIKFAAKPADKQHTYGHGKYETMATALVGGSLLVVGVAIGWDGLTKAWLHLHGETVEAPGGIALVAAAISIALKEWLYRYTAVVADQIKSQALLANAWHHRSDAFSSIGTLLGIGGAIFLGGKWRVLDPIVAVLVSLFIIKVSLSIASRSFRELCEESLGEETEAEIVRIVAMDPSATEAHNLRTRRIGNEVAIDLHVRVEPRMTVEEAHGIASGIEERLRRRFGRKTFVSVHVEPLKK